MKKILFTLFLASATVLCAGAKEARLLRFPSTNGTEVTFTYAGDLYKVSIDGGTAVRLTASPGFEIFSKYSPDGRTIAFTGQFDGNTELYSIPAEGGSPKRLTYSATVVRDDIGDRMGPNNILMGWSPDGSELIYRSRCYAFSGMRANLFTVSSEGGLPVQVPSTEAGFCSFSPDGKSLAFNRVFREFRTWKYYRGGQADDIWINKIGTTEISRITDNDAQDIEPMWIGDEIYFLSDRDHWMNLFCYNTKSKETRKVTDFKRYDCKFASCFAGNGGWVVFENGGYIYKYSVKDGSCKKIDVTLNSDELYSRDVTADAADDISAYTISPDGKRVLFTARGIVFSLPAKEGATYQLIDSPSSHEREATWSNDGKKIAWLSDKSGEYQLYVTDYDKVSENASPVTSFKNGYPSNVIWSDDSKYIFLEDEKNDIFRYDLASGKTASVFKSEGAGFRDYDISPDASWLAVADARENDNSSIVLVDLKSLKVTRLTDRWHTASQPLFSKDGKYLYFTSNRTFSPQYSQVEWNYSGSFGQSTFIVPLTASAENPVKTVSDEYVPGKASDDDSGAPAPGGRSVKPGKPGMPERPEGAGKPDGAKSAEGFKPAETKIDLDGIQERITMLPMDENSAVRLVYATDDGLYYYGRGGRRTPGAGGPGAPRGNDEISVMKYDLKSQKSEEAFKGMAACINPVTGKMLLSSENKYYISDFPSGRKSDPVPTDNMTLTVDRHAEWNQIFEESWRITRDRFYAVNMHGTDWKDIHDKYAELLPYVEYRNDLTYIIGEMLAELNVGHAYITSPAEGYPGVGKVSTGMLGGRFAKEGAAFKITKVFKGADWEESLVSPLDEPGVNAKAGEYITAVNGKSCAGMDNIYESLVGKVGKTVSLTIASDAKGKNARTVYVKPVASETELAYYEWVNRNIEIVDKASNGRIGYIHIPDMGPEGLVMFTKLFYTQMDKDALVIDDRMNGGGNVSPMILERLNREVYRMTKSRNSSVNKTPDAAQYGPKVCLVDKYSSSDGDLFPWGFQKLGIGPLIGERTWGGVTGIGGSMPFVDGQDMRTPTHGTFSTDGQWIIEGHGVDPDIECDINPYEDYKGDDAQLNKAVELLLEKLKDFKPLPADQPADPVRPQK